MRESILIIILIGSLFGNTYDDGKKAYESKDYLLSAKLYKESCDAHNDKACHSLGVQYLEGKGIEKDERVAYRLFNYLCKKSVAESCHNLGYMYANNLGVSKNIEKAISLYKKGCELKDYTACYRLGTQYFTDQDYKNALKYYTIASKQGNGYADHGLGAIYFKGYGVPKDTSKAMYFYTKACLNKEFELSFTSCAIVGGTFIKEKNYADARIYLEKTCNAKENLTSIAANTGRDVKDFKNAISEACTNLGTLYYKGYGVKQSYIKARKLYRKACDMGQNIACKRYNILIQQ